ncbi:kinase [Wenjunlia tyrosinilytica]|uniref:Kinase n=1 Tax=Wenjunlia tyrosinilytica TaxID=1544741 RepID=A0A917ZSK1_9ACTN|nr:kinase [Wenjunlia tyrosinilytica]
MILGVDGGNSKTDVVCADTSGRLLARRRGGPFRPQVDGIAPALGALEVLLRETMAEAGLDSRPVGRLSAFLAGADLPSEEAELSDAVAARGWAEHSHVANDCFALLHAGSTRGWGVAVVCGTGINCVAVAPDGATARFPALGAISGDWGGGADLGAEVLWHAVRDEDGRGPRTALGPKVAAHFGTSTVAQVTEALHTGRFERSRLSSLTLLLFASCAEGDPVARAILDRQADEVTAMALTALRRLGLTDTDAEVFLGGGVLAARDPYLTRRIEDGLALGAPRVRPRVVTLPPVAGAAMHALAGAGADVGAQDRLRSRFEVPEEQEADIRPEYARGTGPRP